MFLKNIIFATRTLRKQPGFAAIAIITIGLGIGACTAIFSVVNAVLLRPLPYADPGRLVLVWSELRARNVPDFPFPIPDVKDLRTEARTFDGFAGVVPVGRATIAGDDGQPEQIRTGAATPNLFALLGVHMYLGRDFTEDDGTPQPAAAAGTPSRPPQLPAIAVLSYGFWQRRYGGDPSVVGRFVDLGNNRAQIVGVLQPGFELLFPPRTGMDPTADMWLALRLNFETSARNTGVLRVIGRLKRGVPLERAQAELEGIAAAFRDRYPLKKNADLHIRVVPMHDDLVSDVKPSIFALVGAVVFVLLIACANVANLLVVRFAQRQRELVIRAAIGGSRRQLVVQMLTETLLLAVPGAALGLWLADSGIQLLFALRPAKLPRLDAIAIDPAVLAFAVAAALVTTVVCGIVPAMRAASPDVADALRHAGSSSGLRAGRRLRHGVVIAEVALSFTLLVASGLMLRSLSALHRVDPGYDATHILTFLFQLRQPTPEARTVFLRQAAERLRAIPGVQDVSAATPVPLDGAVLNVPWATEAAAADPSAFRQANFFSVRTRYFETLKTRLIAGRTFTDADDTRDARKVIVDDLLAARAFGGAAAVGQRLLVRNLRGGPAAPQNEAVEIVGIVAHQRHESLSAAGREAIYFPEQYLGPGAAGRWMVRTSGDPEAMAPAIRGAMAELDPKLPLGDVQPMTAFLDRAMAPIRFTTTLIGIFAAVAAALAGIGLYGVLATAVRQRTAEIGMRMVFGAPQRTILTLVVGEGLKLSGIGMLAGLIAALTLTRVLATLLVSVSPTDLTTFVAIVLVFGVIATVASWLPARRAARLDPIRALRED